MAAVNSSFTIQEEDDIFKFKNFGSYVSNYDISNSSLGKATFLLHRFHSNTIYNEINLENLKVIHKECQKLLSSNENGELDRYILNNIYNGINVLTSSNEQPIKQNPNIKQVIDCTNVAKLEFVDSLILENIYYGKLTDQLIDNYDFKIPSLDNSISTYYLIKIIKEHDLNQKNIKSDLLKFFTDIINNNITDDELLLVLQNIVEHLKFPNADDINKNEYQLKIANHLKIVMDHYTNFQKENFAKWEKIIVEIVSKTFQSSNAAGLASKFFSIKGDTLQAELYFKNFIVFVEKNKELNNVYDDLLSILNVCNFNKNKKQVSHFIELIYNSYDLTVINRKETMNILENNKFELVKLPDVTNKILLSSWMFLHSTIDVNVNIEDYYYYLTNIFQLKVKDETALLNYEHQYAYNLALIKQNEKSSQWLKQRILKKQPTDNLPGWLLLAILESSKEDKLNSLTIVNSILTPLNIDEDEEIDEEDIIDIENLTFENRYLYIIFKFLQIDIIAEIHDVSDSIELLPSLFQLYEKLFIESNNYIENKAKPRYTKEYVLQLVWLQAAKLYQKNNQKEEALKCLKEIADVDVDFKNLNAISMKGFVSSDISQFENVLGYDATNLIALIGYAELILKDEKNSSLEYKNKLSAIGLKISTAINTSIQCRYSGQLQLLLFKIYKVLGHGKDLQQDILLSAIECLENETILDPWIIKL